MQRIDKWLWYARAVKTRSRAAECVADGLIRVNGARVDAPAKQLRIGDVVTAALPERLLVWKVLDDGERRGPAVEARTLYEDLSPPPAPVAPEGARPAERDPGAGRPTKQERRAIDRLLKRSP